MRFLTYLDSRQSTGSSPATCSFNLNQTILGGTQVRVVSFVFANSLYNVVSGLNTLIFDTVTITVSPAFWTFADLLANINAQLMATPAFVAKLGGNPAAITLSAANTALFTIGTNGLIGGSMYPSFFFPAGSTHTANFETGIFLSSPMCVALTSPALQGPDRFITTYPTPVSSPFYLQHVVSGWGEMESSASSLQLQYAIPLGHTSINNLQIQLTDPNTNRVLSEISQWSLILEVSTSSR